MEVLSILGLGVKAKWREGMRRTFGSKHKTRFSPNALDLLTEEAVAYLFSEGRKPRYGDAEYLVDRLEVYHNRLIENGAKALESGAIGVREIMRLREEGVMLVTRRSPPWG
jgi:hypothetical protein